MQAKLGRFLRKAWEDCRAEAQAIATYEQRYEWVEAQCNIFGVTVEAIS
jgi:hypothetical protein